MISKNDFNNLITAVEYSMKEHISHEISLAVKQMMEKVIDGTVRDEVRAALQKGVTVVIR